LTEQNNQPGTAVEPTNEMCTVEVVRGDTGEKHAETFTIEDAKRAKLAGKDVWQSYPRRMLLARAVSDCCRFICPEIALGFYAEGDDFTDPAEGIEVQPPIEAEQDIAEAEVVEPEKVEAEALPLPPANYECGYCEAIGDHYEDECPKAATPQ
jgi:hypothetical protein